VLLLGEDLRTRRWRHLGPLAVLLVDMGAEYLSDNWRRSFADPQVQTAVEDFYHYQKVNEMTPQRTSRRGTRCGRSRAGRRFVDRGDTLVIHCLERR